MECKVEGPYARLTDGFPMVGMFQRFWEPVLRARDRGVSGA